MNTSSSYTPLECLLLFQSLVTHGADDHEFVRISDLLTNNPLVKDGETYNAQRLSADSLQKLYLNLLRDELRAEDQDGSDEAGQGHASPRKRKAPSPSLPSIKDALEYKEKIPMLVDRLYARYRENIVQAIAEDERRYAALQKEIQEIERGEWDEKILQETQAGSKNGVTAVPGHKTNGVGSDTSLKESNAVQIPKQPYPEPLPSPRSESRPEGLAISDVLNRQEAPAAASPKLPDPRSTLNQPPQNTPPVIHQRTGSNGPNGPSPFQPPPGSYHPNGALIWEQPYGPGHQPPPYQSGPYPQYANPQYPPGYHQRQGSFSSPHALPRPHPHVPSSPINAQHSVILPPPNPSRSPSTPGLPLNALADMAGQHQQYRHASGSPLMQPGPMTYQQPFNPQQRPPSGNGPPPQWNPNPNHNPQFAPSYPQTYPQAQHIQYPPNQRQSPFQPPPLPQAARGYESPYPKSQLPVNPASRPIQGARGLMIQSNSSLPSTPVHRGPFINQTGSGTRWTPKIQGSSTPKSSYQVQRPEVEPLSPVLKPAKLPEPTPEPASETTPKPFQKTTKKTPKTKQAPPRGTTRVRAGSTASSVVAGSHRSQSVMSHADEMSVDGRIVKEEVATPSGVEDAGDTTADELPRSISRPGPSAKRKRARSIEPRPASSPATHVRWTRAFPKISASALEAITGHKNASTFAAPVKERDAPGYKTLIRRPQDLKSIRSAILAGHRAATAAAPTDINPNAISLHLPISEDIIPPKGIVNYSQFEKEIMRMFANAVMFNADPDRGLGPRWRGGGSGHSGEDSLGYEIDEDGVVNDTKHMFVDTEKIIGSLRAAERRSEEFGGSGGPGGLTGPGNTGRESSVGRASTRADDDDDTADGGESHTGTAKRRRKA